MEAGASGENAANTAADAVTFRKTQHHTQIRFPTDPEGTAMRIYLLQMDPDLTLEQLRSECSRNGKLAFATPSDVEQLIKEEKDLLTLDQNILEAGKAEPGDLNGIAWVSLFTGKVEGSDLEDALKAAQLSQNNAAMLHTLGCVYAEVGKTKEAREVLIQAMDSLNLEEPDENYWYAFGRIAEQYGEYDAARSDYMRVTRPKKQIDIHDSSYQLAQIRLKAMGSVAQVQSPTTK
jgi:tetratricopeptide (TPR) repeat protein